jgi:hypothetical protein
MIKSVISKVLVQIEKWVDDTQSAETMQAFIHLRAPGLLENIQVQSGAYSAACLNEFRRIDFSALSGMENIRPYARLIPDDLDFNSGFTETDFLNWQHECVNGVAVNKHGLVRQTGLAVLWWLEQGDLEESFGRKVFGNLLRHAEIKRQAGFRLRGKGTETENWIEKHQISLALIRMTKRTKDLRYLNAALKMNDWAFPVMKRRKNDECLAWYCFALIEQETTVKELLGCV